MKTNVERMDDFVKSVFSEYALHQAKAEIPYPRISAVDQDGEPDDSLVDAHWKEPAFEMLLSCCEGSFSFYGDNYGDKKLRKAEATPKDVADALYALVGA